MWHDEYPKRLYDGKQYFLLASRSHKFYLGNAQCKHEHGFYTWKNAKNISEITLEYD